jgi:hypothetical protein
VYWVYNYSRRIRRTKMIKKIVTTPEGTVTLKFSNESCQGHFENMKERDQSQLALSRALWIKQAGRESTRCDFCEETL